ncbi:MAG: amino acid ABC transporter substrate-binding protein, partial [Acidimicrobiia bacterium]|nr:amino acid ABC transporter substrate-binding protein [Acidimicrobiia bacterium]
MFKRLAGLLLALMLVATACGDDEGGGGGLLQTITDRGNVICGVNDAVPGFGFTDETGQFSGFDVEYCRAVAAAVFGDASKVEFVPLTAAQRFTSLQSGEIDVLIRNTTATASRDGTEGATFLTTTFYDGQGMMVRTGEFTSIDDMANTTICVLTGTTTELNLTARFAGIPFTASTFESNDPLREAFVSGQCDGWTSDKSQLAGVKSGVEEAGVPLTILDETFSKEPLGPVVADGDSQWAQVVNWTVFATIQAEEWGITKANVATLATGNEAIAAAIASGELGGPNATVENIAKFLGIGETDPGLGLSTDFVVDVISAVGNYGEIYEANVGVNTPLGLARAANELWFKG